MKLYVELLRTGAKIPKYAKDLDVGADLFLPEDIQIHEGANKIPLGIAVHIPNGYVGFVLPRSGISSRYPLSVLPVPIDPSYTGEIHAIVQSQFEANFSAGDRIAQLVILPAVRAQFVTDELGKRGNAGFGSTGILSTFEVKEEDLEINIEKEWPNPDDDKDLYSIKVKHIPTGISVISKRSTKNTELLKKRSIDIVKKLVEEHYKQ